MWRDSREENHSGEDIIMENRKKGFGGYLMVLASAILWGTLPVISSICYRLGSNGITAGAMRAYLAALIFLIWLLADGSLKKLKLSEVPFYLIYGIAAGGGTFVFYMMAIESLSVSMAAMLLYTAPAFVVIFDRIFYRVPINRYKLAAVAGCFTGSFLVVKGYDLSAFTGSMTGILTGLGAGVSYSLTSVLGKKAKRFHDGKMNSGLMVIFGSLAFLFLKPPYEIGGFSGTLILLYLCLAVVGTVIPYFLYLKGIDQGIDIGAASMIATVEPVVGTVLGAVVLKETLQWPQVLGMGIMIFGILLSVKGQESDPDSSCR